MALHRELEDNDIKTIINEDYNQTYRPLQNVDIL